MDYFCHFCLNKSAPAVSETKAKNTYSFKIHYIPPPSQHPFRMCYDKSSKTLKYRSKLIDGLISMSELIDNDKRYGLTSSEGTRSQIKIYIRT